MVLSILVGFGVAPHRVEAMLPLPSPQAKLGLATVLRIFLGGIFGGTFFIPTFFLTFSPAF